MIVLSALACWCANKNIHKDLQEPLKEETIDLHELKGIDKRLDKIKKDIKEGRGRG